MSVGKYSPTVDRWYAKDQQWWEKNGGGDVDINYDKDGFDRYGYDKNDKDRAGNYENDYMRGRWDTNDNYVYELYEDTYSDWNEPVPTSEK